MRTIPTSKFYPLAESNNQIFQQHLLRPVVGVTDIFLPFQAHQKFHSVTFFSRPLFPFISPPSPPSPPTSSHTPLSCLRNNSNSQSKKKNLNYFRLDYTSEIVLLKISTQKIFQIFASRTSREKKYQTLKSNFY